MSRPKKKPTIVRMFLYLIASARMISIIKNWYDVPLAVFGLRNFRKGHLLHLRNGTHFEVFHFMEALTINEIFGENDYRLKEGRSTHTIIDIGANIGTFSIFAALKNPGAKVIAYEPSKKTFHQFCENISLNKLEENIFPKKQAIGGKNGKLKLYDSGISGQKSIYRTRGEGKYESVEVITLKDVFSKNRINVCDFMKIDCEGAEYDILMNTPKDLFKKIRKISLEFHEIKPDQDHSHLTAFLKGVGYKVSCNYHNIENNIGYIWATR